MPVLQLCDRCVAILATNEQCSRRRKVGTEYCGTHKKSITNDIEIEKETKIDVWAEEVNGIIQFVDGSGHCYKVEDVLSGTIKKTSSTSSV